jgi:hypothetical protein
VDRVRVVHEEVLDSQAGIAGDTWNAARMKARRNEKSRGRRCSRGFEEKSAGAGHGVVGRAEVVAIAAVVVKVYAVEERVPVQALVDRSWQGKREGV